MQTAGHTAECTYKNLFEPLQIKQVKLRNRIVLPAIVTNYGTPEGFVTQGLITFQEARAEHTGLNIVEVTSVRPRGEITTNQLRIYDDRFIPGLAKLAKAIKAKGAAAILQIGDIGARAGTMGAVADPIAPSRITLGPKEARELTIDEIRELVAAHSEAARRAAEAGFDGVELHGAHLYLIGEFLSPFTNKRTDAYGGSVENRTRFLLEIIEAIKAKRLQNFLLFCRINAFEPFEGGIEMKDVITISKCLEQAGIDVLNVSGICQKLPMKYEGKEFDWFTSACPRDWPEGNEIKYAAVLKKAVNIPTAAVGKIFSPQLAENILALHQADLIAMARALIADPELPRKAFEGREHDILRCREDFRCLKSLGERKPMMCVVDKCLPPNNIDNTA